MVVNCNKKQPGPHKNFTGYYEKSVELLDKPQDTQNIERSKRE